MKSNAAKDVFLTEHDGRVSSGDECPGPTVEALPGANGVVRRNRRHTRQHGLRRSRGSRRMGIRVARDHLAVLTQFGSAHHSTGSAQTPPAEAAPSAFPQTVRGTLNLPFLSEDSKVSDESPGNPLARQQPPKTRTLSTRTTRRRTVLPHF